MIDSLRPTIDLINNLRNRLIDEAKKPEAELKEYKRKIECADLVLSCLFEEEREIERRNRREIKEVR